jgi:hypothetical protein
MFEHIPASEMPFEDCSAKTQKQGGHLLVKIPINTSTLSSMKNISLSTMNG